MATLAIDTPANKSNDAVFYRTAAYQGVSSDLTLLRHWKEAPVKIADFVNDMGVKRGAGAFGSTGK